MAPARLLLDFLARGRTFRYGPHRSQCADLHLPRVPGPHPVMVLVHGGSWHRRYGKLVMRALAGDLVRRGWAVWNIEYRRLGERGFVRHAVEHGALFKRGAYNFAALAHEDAIGDIESAASAALVAIREEQLGR